MDDTVPALFRRSMAGIFLSFDCCFAFLILQQNSVRTLCLAAFVARFAMFCNCRTVVDPGRLLLLARNIFKKKLEMICPYSQNQFYVDRVCFVVHSRTDELCKINIYEKITKLPYFNMVRCFHLSAIYRLYFPYIVYIHG